jgi:hypothetical protein
VTLERPPPRLGPNHTRAAPNERYPDQREARHWPGLSRFAYDGRIGYGVPGPGSSLWFRVNCSAPQALVRPAREASPL